MDASDQGIAVLESAAREFFVLTFSEAEATMFRSGVADAKLSIDVREQLAILIEVYRALSTATAHLHVRCWTDNASAVAWTNHRRATSDIGKTLNRAIGLAEVVFGIHVLAAHIPGCATAWRKQVLVSKNSRV